MAPLMRERTLSCPNIKRSKVHQGDLSLSAGPVKTFWTQHFFDRNTVSYEATVQFLFSKDKISNLKHSLHYFINKNLIYEVRLAHCPRPM